MRNLAGILILLTAFAGSPPWAQTDTVESISKMLVTELSPTREMEGGEWFTSADAQGNATRALGVIYVHVPGSAGTVGLHAGLFAPASGAWAKTQDVTGLAGMEPRNVVFHADRVELTTTTLGPDDPRCCPTQEVRWRVDLATGAASKLN